jgi:hypothetical protein
LDFQVPERKRQKIIGSHPGRSCAFDFESEQSWPIVIEDLESSGHMLIEVCRFLALDPLPYQRVYLGLQGLKNKKDLKRKPDIYKDYKHFYVKIFSLTAT